MDFSQALIEAKNGSKISRTQFMDTCFIEVFRPAEGSLITEPIYRDWETDRKSTRLNSSHITRSRMPSSA